jgi:hypothetical protein
VQEEIHKQEGNGMQTIQRPCTPHLLPAQQQLNSWHTHSGVTAMKELAAAAILRWSLAARGQGWPLTLVIPTH